MVKGKPLVLIEGMACFPYVKGWVSEFTEELKFVF